MMILQKILILALTLAFKLTDM